MLCRKCKTAVMEGDPHCAYCHAKVSTGLVRKWACLLFVSATVLVCGVYLSLSLTGRIMVSQDNPVSSPEVTGEGVASNPTATPSASQTPAPNLSRPQDKVTDLLTAVNEAALLYIDSLGDNPPVVSLGGYPYNIGENSFITTETLISEGFLDEQFTNENVILLYLRPVDFNDLHEVNFSMGRDLELFAACDTQNGLALLSSQNSGVAHRENINVVLINYSSGHGEVERLLPGDKRRSDMLASVQAYLFMEEDFDTRFLCADDKYSVVIISTKGDSSNLMGFVLERTGGSWSVALSGLEEAQNLAVYVNGAFPDLNLGLLPFYSPREHKLLPEGALKLFISAVRDSGDVDEKDEVSYIAGTNQYVYAVFRSGKQFLFSRASNFEWDYEEVRGWTYVESRIIDDGGFEHLSVIRQE